MKIPIYKHEQILVRRFQCQETRTIEIVLSESKVFFSRKTVLETYSHRIFKRTRDYMLFYLIFEPKNFFMLLKMVKFNLITFYSMFKLKS